jgi:hypothetical protein
MIVFSLLLIGAFLAAIYYFAVYIVPIFVGVWAGIWAFNSGAGIGSPIIGLLAGGTVFALGQYTFHVTRSVPIRLLVMSIFGVPAALAAYNAVLELTESAIPSSIWRHMFALAGAVVTGWTAATRVATMPDGMLPRAVPDHGQREDMPTVYPPPPRPAGVDDVVLVPEQPPTLTSAPERRLLPPASR